MRGAAGHSSTNAAAPTSTILTRPLANSTSERSENRRLAPAVGEMRSSFGASGAALQTGPCWIRPLVSAAPRNSSAAGSRIQPSRQEQRLERAPASRRRWRRHGAAREMAAAPGEAHGAVRREHADEQRARSQHKGVVDLARAGDLPLAPRLLEPSLARLLGLLRLIVVFGHRRSRPPRPRPARPSSKNAKKASRPAAKVSMTVANAARICSGRAMKNTWKVGISRLSTPIAR